ncbi:MAG TPA: FkbM family methyltransferase [Bryobacteraceae bacterium]|nr:FkbM family methyltransferase [Bryobacteraceae bacterium]
MSLFARLFRAASWAVASCFALLALIMLLAPRYDWAWQARTSVTAAVFRPAKFAPFARSRDPHCSLADAWREAVPKSAILARGIERRIRQVQRDGDLEEIDTPDGRWWIPAGDRLSFAEELAEQSQDEYGTDLRGVVPKDVVLDCGANAGVFTRQALRHGASKVVAIEPAPWALECLRRNFAEEIRAGRVLLYPKGVWDHDDTLELNIPPGMASTAATVALQQARGKAFQVPLTTIDRMASELKLERVDFIKMDIEGAEPNALRGAVQTVGHFHPRLAISLEHRPTDPETIPALTRRLWPDYRVECGVCTNMKEHLQPVVMFARQLPNSAAN